MAIQFDLPKEKDTIIKVIGVGGGGSNAVTHMHDHGIIGVNFAICNTDAQALAQSVVPTQIKLGPGLTDGRGAGSKPEIGRGATLESLDEIKQVLSGNTKMVFITAGMGGGTGTGGAPIVAKAAKELGLLTVGIVTTPFFFEGRKRIMQAQKGIEELKANVDTIIVISNDKLRELHGNLTLSEAFTKADDVLATAAKGIAEIITVPGYVNVDFEDVNTVMKDSGVAIMGTGVADGDDRALKAVKTALASPLLNDNDITGAKHILLNITSGTQEVLMDEVSEITNFIQEAAGYTSEVIWGNGFDEDLGEKISVTVIATGFESHKQRPQKNQTRKQERIVLNLDDEPKSRKRPQPQQPQRRQQFRQQEEQYEAPRPRRRSRINFEEEDNGYNSNGGYRNNDGYNNDNYDNYNKGGYNKDSYNDDYNTNSLKNSYEQEETDYSNSYSNNNYSDNSYSQPERRQRPQVNNEDDRMRVFMERRKRLRGLSMKLQSSMNVNDLEKEPAYKRRNIELDDIPHSSDSQVSKYSLMDDENQQARLKKRNPFLHDNVD